MPEKVNYSKKADANAYAREVGGHVIEHDTNEDGTPDTWTVEVEGATEGPSLRDFEEGTSEY